MENIAVVTTFGNNSWDVYAKQMLESFVRYWPQAIPLMVQLDDDLLFADVDKILRPQDGIAVGQTDEHKSFIERNKSKDDPLNYRMQPVRFCHKVFALKRGYDAAMAAKANGEPVGRYIIWWDADVITTRIITYEDIIKCLPKEGDAVSYLGRKDWDHSECGFLGFDLDNGGGEVIEAMYKVYVDEIVLTMPQQHDSYVFDTIRPAYKCTNLTEGKSGMEIWPQSPMAPFSIHYKGPVAKNNLFNQMVEKPMRPAPGQNFVIQTKNALPSEEIRKHIEENQKLITNWILQCEKNDETIALVSAGPLLIAEEVKREIEQGNKIVAVKHALVPLKKAGITPWACILLDPRPHVLDFVQEADKNIKWFVASQVNPDVTKALIERGCEIWGYHATVGADEQNLIMKQPDSIISGGSATATRGLYLLSHLGFDKFNLYGYDLSVPDKPDLNAKDTIGQPKYMEFSFSVKDAFVDVKRCFYSEPQLMAQFEEINGMIQAERFQLKAFGDGLVPFAIKFMNLSNLRKKQLRCNMGVKLSSYKELFKWNKTKKTRSLQIWRRILLLIRQKLRDNSR